MIGTQVKLNAKDILKMLPHRFPFLLIDEVTSISETGGKGKKNITISEPCFQGHFPDNPVYPGVFQLEGLAQCGAVVGIRILQSQEEFPESIVPSILFLGIDSCRFKRVVVPGDCLEYTIEFSKLTSKLVKFKAIASVEGLVACEADMVAMFRIENDDE